MNLSWKDAITTLLAGVVVVVAIATVKKWDIAIINNPRWAALLMVLAGVVMCNLVATTPEHMGMYEITMGTLGVTAVLGGILALIFGAVPLTVTVAVVVVAMWAVSTLRHMVTF